MIILESPPRNTPIVGTRPADFARFSRRDVGRAHVPARCSLFEPPGDEASSCFLLYQMVALQGVEFVDPCRYLGRRPVQGSAGGPTRLLPALPEAERQALAPLVRLPLEVEKKTARFLGFGVSSVVVLSQEVESADARRTDRQTTTTNGRGIRRRSTRSRLSPLLSASSCSWV
jgi:hypothetical protein